MKTLLSIMRIALLLALIAQFVPLILGHHHSNFTVFWLMIAYLLILAGNCLAALRLNNP